jgi:hypothetical protein
LALEPALPPVPPLPPWPPEPPRPPVEAPSSSSPSQPLMKDATQSEPTMATSKPERAAPLVLALRRVLNLDACEEN